MSAATAVSVPAPHHDTTTSTSNGNGMIPLASPMRWDPHHGQISFGSLAALAAPPPVLQPELTKEPLFLGLDLSTQVCHFDAGVSQTLTAVRRPSKAALPMTGSKWWQSI